MRTKKILWVGAGKHSPQVTVMRQYNGINIHTSSEIGVIENFPNIDQYNIDENTPDLPQNFSCDDYCGLFLTWNYFELHAHPEWLRVLSSLEDMFVARNLPVRNSLKHLKALQYKNAFFSLLQERFPENIPYYRYPARWSSCLFFPYPALLRSNSSTGGKDTFYVENAAGALMKMKSANINDPMLVKCYDTKDSGYYVAYRVLLCNNKINFAFPQISATHIATALVDSTVPLDVFMHFSEKAFVVSNKYAELFFEVQNILNINTLAIDFIEYKDRIIFLEPELKYGPGDVYTVRTLSHYNISIDNILSSIPENMYERCTLNDIFNITS